MNIRCIFGLHRPLWSKDQVPEPLPGVGRIWTPEYYDSVCRDCGLEKRFTGYDLYGEWRKWLAKQP